MSGRRAHWILRAIARVEGAGDWPVLVALAFCVGALVALGATGAL